MGMGKRRRRERQEELWVATADLVPTPRHAFYEKLEALLRAHHFDEKVEHLCRRFYSGPRGRPSIAPGVYFRCMFVGYFEGLDSERGIAWRLADSISLKYFLGYRLDEPTPDHSTISRTRRLFWLSTHQAVFRWVLTILKAEGLLIGRKIGIDATTLEANAAMRSIVHRETGEDYRTYLKGLAEDAGIEEPTASDLARFDRKRAKSRKKRASNRDWHSPVDPDARITKMKDGSTHLAHKAEHAVDLDTGAIVAVTIQGADTGDTTSVFTTLGEADDNATEVCLGVVDAVVADRGYHSGAVLTELEAAGLTAYISEPKRGRRRWKGRNKEAERRAVGNNRRRLRGDRNKALQAKRAELNERSNAHMYETGGLRRVYLRGRENVAKRVLLQAAAFDLSLILRKQLGAGTPRGFSDLLAARIAGTERLAAAFWALGTMISTYRAAVARVGSLFTRSAPLCHVATPIQANPISATGC
jgi:transposase